MRRVMLCCTVVSLSVASCNARFGGPKKLTTAEAAQTAFSVAFERDAPQQVLDLLDKDSRFAVHSIYESHRQLAALVKSRYPADRQARELSRVQLALAAPDAAHFFRALMKQSGQWQSLKNADKKHFCSTEGTYGYCGLRAQLEEIKLRAARDLASVQESVEENK